MSDFSAARCYLGIITNFDGDGVSLQRIIFAENTWGAKVWFGQESDENNLFFSNVIFMAMARPGCAFCYNTSAKCSDMRAILIPIVQISGKHIPIDKADPDGLVSQCKDAAFDSKLLMSNVTFFNYKLDYHLDANVNYQKCSNNYVFQQPGVPDSSSRIYLRNVKAKNSAQLSYFQFVEPNPGFLFWRGGCGDFNCSGNKNWILTDLDGSLFGRVAQVTPKNLGISASFCQDVDSWNGRLCEGKNFGIIEFQNDGPDQRMRLISPLNVTSDIMKNTLNEWREWKWIGTDPMDKRLARFNGMVQTNVSINMEFEVVVPEELKLKLEHFPGEFWWTVIKIQYERPNVIEVWNMVNKTFIKPYKKTDNVNLTDLALNPQQCGANIYDPDNSTIQFVLNSELNCILKVRTIDSVRITLHYATTVEDFYKNTGEASFFDKIRAFLGIDMARIRIAGIRSGSVIIVFDVVEDKNLTNSTSALDTENSTYNGSNFTEIDRKSQELANFGTKLCDSINNGSLVLTNATVLGVSYAVYVVNISNNTSSNNQSNNQTNNQTNNETNNQTNNQTNNNDSWNTWSNNGSSNSTRNTTTKVTTSQESNTTMVILLATIIPVVTVIFLLICCCLKNKEGITMIKLAFDYSRHAKSAEISFNQELMMASKAVSFFS